MKYMTRLETDVSVMASRRPAVHRPIQEYMGRNETLSHSLRAYRMDVNAR